MTVPLEETVQKYTASAGSNTVSNAATPQPTVWDSFKLYLKTEAMTKAVTLPFVPPIATGANYLTQRLANSAKLAAFAGGTTEWALESAVFYGLMWRKYHAKDGVDATVASTGAEMMKDFWLAETVDYFARPFFTGMGQYLANTHEPGQHPYRTWAGTVAGILVADMIFCTNYLVARHLIKPLAGKHLKRLSKRESLDTTVVDADVSDTIK
jgi:hypothetical protein